MSNKLVAYKAPTLADLISDKDMAFAQDDLNVILNTPVPKDWIKEHPFVKIKVPKHNPDGTPAIAQETGKPIMIDIQLPYVPIKRVKYLLKRIYGKYQWKITECKQVLNAMVVTGTLTITNPITGEKESQDGVGAAAIQMDKGATQGDLSAIKANAIQLGAPAAESYALKNAAEKFGDIFGGNIYDVDKTSYTPVFGDDVRNPATLEDITELFELKKDSLSAEQLADAERILLSKEHKSYNKLYKILQTS